MRLACKSHIQLPSHHSLHSTYLLGVFLHLKDTSATATCMWILQGRKPSSSYCVCSAVPRWAQRGSLLARSTSCLCFWSSSLMQQEHHCVPGCVFRMEGNIHPSLPFPSPSCYVKALRACESGSSCVTVTQRDVVCNGSRDAKLLLAAHCHFNSVAKKPQLHALRHLSALLCPSRSQGRGLKSKLKNNNLGIFI